MTGECDHRYDFEYLSIELFPPEVVKELRKHGRLADHYAWIPVCVRCKKVWTDGPIPSDQTYLG